MDTAHRKATEQHELGATLIVLLRDTEKQATKQGASILNALSVLGP